LFLPGGLSRVGQIGMRIVKILQIFQIDLRM